jgi:hypothetical protein
MDYGEWGLGFLFGVSDKFMTKLLKGGTGKSLILSGEFTLSMAV